MNKKNAKVQSKIIEDASIESLLADNGEELEQGDSQVVSGQEVSAELGQEASDETEVKIEIEADDEGEGETEPSTEDETGEVSGTESPDDADVTTDPELTEPEGEDDPEKELVDEVEDSQKESACDFSEDIKALNAVGGNLSEDYKSKAAVIFEAAVSSRLATEKAKLQKDFSRRLNENVNRIAVTLAEETDAYLTHAVDSWIKANEVAIDASMRTEITENFMSNLRTLFVENYIDVPESKKDMLKLAESKASTATNELETTKKKLAEASKKLEGYARKAIVEQACSQLTDVQASRLRSLIKDVEFVSEETFTSKVTTLKETYMRASKSPLRKESRTGVTNGNFLSEDTKDLTERRPATIVDKVSDVLARKRS